MQQLNEIVSKSRKPLCYKGLRGFFFLSGRTAAKKQFIFYKYQNIFDKCNIICYNVMIVNLICTIIFRS